MAQTQIVVADGTRARFFGFHRGDRFSKERDALVETTDLYCPTRRARLGDTLSESRPGLNASGSHLKGHALDDRRHNHRDELERRFAVDIAQEIEKNLASGCQKFILLASPTMLGKLRGALQKEAGAHGATELVERPLNLSKLTAPELLAQLVKAGLLPSQRRTT